MSKRKGIILAGGSGTRLYPSTISMSKQLMPVYDKPMIYYPLSVLLLTDIREVLIITTPHDRPFFEALLKDGSQWGIELSYAEQPKPEGLAQAFIIGAPFLEDADASVLVLGDNLFYGQSLPDILTQAANRGAGATIFGYPVNNPSDYGVVTFDAENRVIDLEEKPAEPKSDYAVPGIYFYDEKVVDYAANLKPSARGELEITDLNRCYLEDGNLYVEKFGRGIAWLDTGTHDSLLDASNFVSVIEKRQGYKIACLEEIAFRRGWINVDQLEAIAAASKSSYYSYLKRIAKRARG